MYLAKISIENFRGIERLDVEFQPDINVIIGENGSNKTGLIDAIRLLYSLGDQQKSIYVSADDFHIGTSTIKFTYEFKGLNSKQKGAFYEYLVICATEENDIARITVTYQLNPTNQKVKASFYTGEIEGQRADSETFQLFIHYYLGALRDSTKDLLVNRGNILGNLISRQVKRNKTEDRYQALMSNANRDLLKFPEVITSKDSINTNLSNIFKNSNESNVGLRIQDSKTESIVSIIKPYLPHDKIRLEGEGLDLKQNSLGFNNLIYIATVLGDINQQLEDDEISHYALLIEEPEAHLHPQLQLCLFDFLKATNSKENSQLFITTHSPTLTSKVPIDNLLLISKTIFNSIRISSCFEKRETIKIEEDGDEITDDPIARKKQLEKYIDVKKSQLFFSNGVLFVEGISEELLVPVFSMLENQSLQDYRIEIINIGGTSFYPFIYLFNSANLKYRLPMPAAIITDDDRFPDSNDSKFSFKNINSNAALLKELRENITDGIPSSRIKNIEMLIGKMPIKLFIKVAEKTFEYTLIRENINPLKKDIDDNELFKFFAVYQPVQKKLKKIREYVTSIPDGELSEETRTNLALLIWKMIPSKAEFSQEFSVYLTKRMEEQKGQGKIAFNVPKYINDAIKEIVKNIT